MVDIPQGYETLLERPLYGHLATTRPGGNAQVNPMWFDWDGELLRFTHTTKRQKYRNVTANPNVAMSISDPDNPYRYLEVRGVVEEIVPDTTGAFYLHLNDRYTGPLTEPPVDKADRVMLVVRASGLPNETNAMFTNIEGEWDEVMAVVKQAVDAVAAVSDRVSLVLKADIRPGYTGQLTAKVQRIEEALGD